MYVICRFDTGTGKQIRPLSLSARTRTWRWKRPHVMIPWQLDALYARPAAPVVVCEGEKAAEAAQQALPEMVATCGHGGANAVQSTDWGHLAKRQVTIWPDDDRASVEVWARDLAVALTALRCPVDVLDPAKFWRDAG